MTRKHRPGQAASPVLRRFLLGCAWLLAAGTAAAQKSSPAPVPPAGHAHWHSKPEAVAALRLLLAGGNTVFVRHAKTDVLAKDEGEGAWSDCTWQRNLSASGRSASHEMGEAIRLLGIAVGDVWSSPYCRCMDTAWRAFGRAAAAEALAPGPGAPGQGMAASGRALLELATREVPAGTNAIVVGHIFNALGAFGTIPEEGEALVLRRDAGGRPQLIGRLTMTQWGDLVRDVLVFGLAPDSDARLLPGSHARPHPHREP